MITNTGKAVLSKYLIGQAPAYASHIAIGCGQEAKGPTDPLDATEYADRKDMKFEMLRSPIISRGYVIEDGVSKIVFTAELPTQERYEITEVALYSAGSNQYAAGFDSRVLYYFSRQEPWKFGEEPIEPIDIPLDSQNEFNDIDQYYDVNAPVDPRPLVFQTNASNKLFANSERRDRNEQSRFLNNMMMMRGDFSSITADEEIDTANASFISLNPISINLDKNAPTDKIKVAFSIVNTYGNLPGEIPEQPDKARIVVEFVTADSKTAKFRANLDSNLLEGDADFATNRYYVLEANISDIAKDPGFSWSQVTSVRVYGAVLELSEVYGYEGLSYQPSENFYLALDAIRLDNVNSYSPIYGMTGYTVIKTDDARPIVKLPNTSSLIEFRLAVGVG